MYLEVFLDGGALDGHLLDLVNDSGAMRAATTGMEKMDG